MAKRPAPPAIRGIASPAVTWDQRAEDMEAAQSDRRKRCRASPPHARGMRPVTAHLDPNDYRHLYEITMERGTSMSETLRQIIRDTPTIEETTE